MPADIKVVLLEDKTSGAEILVRELQRAGFVPLWQRVNTEAAYLDGLETYPDLILARYSPVPFSTQRALSLLQERDLDIPLIVITDTVDEEAIVDCMKSGAADYLFTDRLARLGPAVTRALRDKKQREEKRREEMALHESEERYRQMFERTYTIKLLIDPVSGAIVDANPAACTFYGYNREKLTSLSITAINTLPVDEIRRRMIQVQNQNVSLFLARHRLASGEIRDVEVYSNPIDLQGRHLLFSIIRDLSEQVRAERALRESQMQNQAILNAIPDLMFLMSKDGVFLDYKADLTRDLVAPPSEFLGKTVAEIMPELAPQIMQAVEQTLQDGSMQIFEYQLVRNGKASNFEARIVASGDDKAVAIVRNITERKQHERQLEAVASMGEALRRANIRNEMLPIIIEQVLDLLKAELVKLIVFDTITGQIAAEQTGSKQAATCDTDSLAFQQIQGHVTETNQPFVIEDIRQFPALFLDGPPTSLVSAACIPLMAHEQMIGLLSVALPTPITDQDMHLLTAIGSIASNAIYRTTIREMLEQRVAERTAELAAANERLKELDHLKSKFVSDVSHELRSPVTSINMRLYLLERDKPEKRAEHLQEIKAQTARLKQLIESILDLSRLELGRDKVVFAPVNLNEVAAQVVAAHVPYAEAAQVAVTFEPHNALPPISGERNQLAQVVTNLLVNAINYAPGGCVQLETGLDQGHVYLTVQDTGIGIEPQDIPHLFERFYRGQMAKQMKIPGSGLGLGIVKEIIDLHHGTVEVESQPGTGSLFRIWLPPL